MQNIEILKKYASTNHFGQFIGLKLEVIKPGEVNYYVKVKKDHLATLKSAHGGFLAAIFDQIVGTAALTKAMLDDKLVSTVEFKINYLKSFEKYLWTIVQEKESQQDHNHNYHHYKFY